MKFARTLSMLALLVPMCTTFAHAADSDDMKKKAMSMDKDKMSNSIPAMLEANEHKVQESFKTKDVAAFNSLVDAGAWMIDPSGINPVTGVPEMMKIMDLHSYTMDNYKTKMIDRDAFISYYSATYVGSMNGQPQPAGPWYCSTVWAKNGKEWKAVFHTETLAMQAPPPATTETTTH